MNAGELERQIRDTLLETVDDVTESSLTQRGRFLATRSARSRSQQWLAPSLAAAVVLVIAGVIGGFFAGSGDRPDSKATIGLAGGGNPQGSWQLAGATSSGRRVDVPAAPVVTLAWRGQDKILINDGVNGTVISVKQGNGEFFARFQSMTYALDPRGSDPADRAFLHLLDSIAPSSHPSQVTRSTYDVTGDQLSIRTPVGELVFKRSATVPGRSSESVGTSTTPAVTAQPSNQPSGPGSVSP